MANDPIPQTTQPSPANPTPIATETGVNPPSSEPVNDRKVSSDYGESQIKVLTDIEHVRLRPGMYIGGYNTRGLHHLVYEIMDNSIDEALAGHAKHIEVVINADGSCTVSDDGRGIPTGIHPEAKIPTVEVVFATLGAGGKFEHDEESAYKTSGGLHGVGASVVNFVSEWMEIDVHRNGEVHHMEFQRGVKSMDLKVIGKTNKTGTIVSFKPDPTLSPASTFFTKRLPRASAKSHISTAGSRSHLRMSACPTPRENRSATSSSSTMGSSSTSSISTRARRRWRASFRSVPRTRLIT